MKYIIATHGNLANGYKSAIEVLIGKTDIFTINAYIGEKDDITSQLEKLLSTFDKDEKVIIFTDILSGSVSQAASRLIGRNVVCITGINLALIMEFILSKEEKTIEEIDFIIEEARKQMVCINRILDKEI